MPSKATFTFDERSLESVERLQDQGRWAPFNPDLFERSFENWNANRPPEPTVPKTETKNLQVACPLCGAKESVKLFLHDLGELKCDSCDEDFTPAEAVRRAVDNLSRWTAVEKWLKSAPTAPTSQE